MTPGSSTATHHGLPTFSDSSRASSSAFSSMTSASCEKELHAVLRRLRPPLLPRLPSPRRRPARRPPTVPLGTSAMTSPVAGLRTSIVSPDVESTNSPPMNCFCWVTETLTRPPIRESPAERIAVTVDATTEPIRVEHRPPCGSSSSEPEAWALPSPQIAKRRSFFEHCALADYDPARPGRGRRRARRRPLLGARDRRVQQGRDRRPDPRDARRRRPQLRRSALQRPDLRRVLRGGRHLPRHGDDALRAASRRTRTRRSASSSATTSSSGPRPGRRRDCSRSSASGSSPARPTSSRATPPTSSSRRSTRSASATARTSSSRATTSRRPSPSGRPSRSASTRP